MQSVRPSLAPKSDMGRVTILTGSRGIGKTTVCRETLRLAQHRGHTCGGILTLARPDARHVYDVRTGAVRRLTCEPHAPQVVVQGRFCFSLETLRWANRALSRSVPCDLLVVDEIGPLELERNEGWTMAFDVLRGGGFELALVVVRPELVASAQLRLLGPAPSVVTVTRGNRNTLPGTLVSMLDRET